MMRPVDGIFANFYRPQADPSSSAQDGLSVCPVPWPGLVQSECAPHVPDVLAMH